MNGYHNTTEDQSLAVHDSKVPVPNDLVLGSLIASFLLSYHHIPSKPQPQMPSSNQRQVVSLYMAYILFFMLQDVCLVCMSIYAVNATILTLAYKALSSGGNGSGGGEKRAANSPVDTDDLAEMKKNS